jgi:hypothetical protein
MQRVTSLTDFGAYFHNTNNPALTFVLLPQFVRVQEEIF